MKEVKILDARAAKEKALRLLEYRAHSEKELYTKLKRAGAMEEDIPPIMDFLKEYGFINDAEYAFRLAKDLHNIKKLGKYRIVGELKNKGICPEDIENAVSQLPDDESEKLLPLVKRRIGDDFDRKNIDKVIRYFVWRGYSIDDIKGCLETLKADTPE